MLGGSGQSWTVKSSLKTKKTPSLSPQELRLAGGSLLIHPWKDGPTIRQWPAQSLPEISAHAVVVTVPEEGTVLTLTGLTMPQ